MNVSQAIATRRSVRAFLPDPIPIETVVEILKLASRAPSGSNLQPWRVYVVAGEVRGELVRRVKAAASELPKGQPPEHKIHPDEMFEPYKSRYMRASGLLYAAAGIEREDLVARHGHLLRNWNFFGAPMGLIFTLRRELQPGQWADVGMFMQNIMLLARGRGWDTCAQEAWALWPGLLHELLEIPPEEIVYCGMALGFADTSAAVNCFESERADVTEFVTIKTAL